MKLDDARIRLGAKLKAGFFCALVGPGIGGIVFYLLIVFSDPHPFEIFFYTLYGAYRAFLLPAFFGGVIFGQWQEYARRRSTEKNHSMWFSAVVGSLLGAVSSACFMIFALGKGQYHLWVYHDPSFLNFGLIHIGPVLFTFLFGALSGALCGSLWAFLLKESK